jgi:XTP/dITP diphosphohydrolase
MNLLTLATRNRHKAEEIGAILGLSCGTLSDLPGAPALVEDADSFAGNAARKAAQLAAWLASRPEAGQGIAAEAPPAEARPQPARRLVLADDSGLEVDALGGAPGVHSARFAALDAGHASNASDAENNAKLLRLLEGVPIEKRTARFRCVLALVETGASSVGAEPRLFEGVCEGHIDFAPRGRGGFGYDPLFVPNGFEESFAELGEGVKNRISHRAQALGRLRSWLVKNYS